MRLGNMKLRILLVIFCLLAGASLLLAGANDRFASVECLNETTLPRDAASQRTQLSASFTGQGEHSLQARWNAGGELQTWSAPNSAMTPPGAWPKSATKKPTAAPWPNTATSATPRPADPRHGKNRRPGRELNREQKLAIRRCRHGARLRASGLHGHEGTSQPHALTRYGDPAGRQVPRGVLGSMMGRK